MLSCRFYAHHNILIRIIGDRLFLLEIGVNTLVGWATDKELMADSEAVDSLTCGE